MRAWIFGGSGMLGRALLAEGLRRGHDVTALGREEADVTRPETWTERLVADRPEIVFNCAAFTRVDDCESEREEAFAVNAAGAGNVARQAALAGTRTVHVSTDYVFDGRARKPYGVDAATAPLSVYGASKLEGERQVLAAPRSLVVRTSWLFGPGGGNFVETMLSLAERRGTPLSVVDDQSGRPTYTPFLAAALWDLAATGAEGVLHYADGPPATWYDFARQIMASAGTGVEVVPVTTDAFPRPAPRPAYSVLDVRAAEQLLGRPVGRWQEGLEDYLAHRKAPVRGSQ